jgi:predicted nucleotidyltransferase
MDNPTPFPALNAVLRDFTESVQAILGENFCGAYLQGSFALGDADEHSNVDFIVVTEHEVSDEHIGALQSMQERLYKLETTWARHLEGSYFPKEVLRRVDPTRTPLVYFDNGETKPVRDNHCNTAVVRWSLREQGVVLAGAGSQEPHRPVQENDLRREVRQAMIVRSTSTRRTCRGRSGKRRRGSRSDFRSARSRASTRTRSPSAKRSATNGRLLRTGSSTSARDAWSASAARACKRLRDSPPM